MQNRAVDFIFIFRFQNSSFSPLFYCISKSESVYPYHRLNFLCTYFERRFIPLSVMKWNCSISRSSSLTYLIIFTLFRFLFTCYFFAKHLPKNELVRHLYNFFKLNFSSIGISLSSFPMIIGLTHARSNENKSENFFFPFK